MARHSRALLALLVASTLVVGGLAACAKMDAIKLSGGGAASGAGCANSRGEAEAALACLRQSATLQDKYGSVRACTSACSGAYYALSAFSAAEDGSYSGSVKCCFDLGPAKAGAGTSSASTPAPTPAPAATTTTKAAAEPAAGQANAAAAGAWSGKVNCDVPTSMFGRGSVLGSRIMTKMSPDGVITATTREQLIQPNFGCKFESAGSCKIVEGLCRSGVAITCTMTQHPVWEDNCGGVSVPRIEKATLCVDGDEMRIIQYSPTCAPAKGTFVRASAGSGSGN